ncbi:zinc finger A20 and AN1 domain-containing stress-associated protein 3-like [Phragmites australis]|uniref:zinc finger A20 and AN1 domain-containing stress-associated protein 3-like n=1 Tax=Phragmites australis TaxID=29695 RepID=UPI002D7822C7|nr:zinc finger A20 and AN1 domain-containing stress-associated protein 3-like [Phragmites australis]
MPFQRQEMSATQPQESGVPPLCAAGCGFFGSSATLDMCSVCYKKHRPVSSEPGAASASKAVVRSDAAAAAIVATTGAAASAGGVSFAPATEAKGVAEATVSSSTAKVAENFWANRCQACLKKVGLTGFVCRCHKTFCGAHRHAEEHGCTFDYMGVGRVAIARNNPLVKGEKLPDKI